MSLFKRRVQYKESADTSLVLASIGGDRDAFGEIVSRYQSLLCSLAYSSVGDLKHSEDIAQETFVDAWRKLDTLAEPEKLKAWLCGILRFKVSRYRRKESRHNNSDSAELDEQESPQPQVDETLIREQEQTLLWQTLQQLPETYREPLILFYREQRSVENVAAELDLTEATVKQRLSRGRKALQTAMVSFVEDTLSKSKPGASFTTAVLLAISTISAPKAKATALGIGAAHTGSAFKWASLLTVFAAFSGLIGSFFSVRASLAQSRTRSERRLTIKIVALYLGIALAFTLALYLLKALALGNSVNAQGYAIASQLVVFAFVISYLYLLSFMLTRVPQLRAQQRLAFPQAFLAEGDRPDAKRREFKTRATLLGVPVLHFKLGMPEPGDKPAVGWVAGGDRAYGLVFAWGGWAVAPVSVGIVSLGFISIGALGIGVLSLGAVAIGVLGLGAAAVAYKAYASLSALGWQSALSGGFSIAQDAALGPVAFATTSNSEQAAQLTNLTAFNHHYLWVLAVMSVLVIVPAVWHSKVVRQRMGQK
ncbi:RNA polymerase sigma factor [Gilvimarinus sp. 1_MG-2023]|uniref:RNA polymerase sigma factor n=1 Tax=Gilvimarinus sp. 1_MG-2023 TaxID=3062638 RepID=UPI0026E37865|nr:sigma-70 family RNA polymerase sigma factor [Gilvimarinus sp. 1_MG-2023]MDO6746710.1 sigma-70 family RNA polymerase sigma factor [Gilvimarinus sp. 1_MG-2023]